MPEFSPTGAFAVDDPYLLGAVSYWLLRGQGLEAWPTGDGGKYGPPRPPRTTPGGSADQRRDAMKVWHAQIEEYRLEILKRIAAAPEAAAARFTANTDRCHRCRGYFHAEHLPETAAAGRGRAAGLLTEEQRNAMVVALRHAEFPEALISEALAMPPGAVNRAARRGGIGKPLEPRKRDAETAGHSVTVITDRDNPGHENTARAGSPATTHRDNTGHDNAGALDGTETTAAADRQPMTREQAETLVRDALLSAVAMATRDIERVDVPAGALLENSDPEVVAHMLALMLGAVLGVVLPDGGGRRLLAQIAATAVTDAGDGE